MADDTTTMIVIVVGILLAVLTYFELKYLRKSSRARRVRAAKTGDELPDQAHNALITAKAIVTTVGRGGVRSDDVDQLMREAQQAYDRRNYRVAIDLTSQAKSRLMALKSAQAAKGDLAKLKSAPAPAEEEPTTKELLQKEFPANLAQSRFAISVAESSIDEAKDEDRDASRAEALLATARSRFEAQDYTGALSAARLAEKGARGESAAATASPGPEVSVTASPVSAPVAVVGKSTCPSCGAPLKADDTFCRKCGAKVVLTACPNCNAELLGDDIFCRKCGTRIER